MNPLFDSGREGGGDAAGASERAVLYYSGAGRGRAFSGRSPTQAHNVGPFTAKQYYTGIRIVQVVVFLRRKWGRFIHEKAPHPEINSTGIGKLLYQLGRYHSRWHVHACSAPFYSRVVRFQSSRVFCNTSILESCGNLLSPTLHSNICWKLSPNPPATTLPIIERIKIMMRKLFS